MLVDAVFQNTKIYLHGNLVEAGIAVDNGKIVKVAKETNLPRASKKFDLGGNITLPGLIDPHVHLRDQKLAYKETFFTGTAAAAAGGITSVIDMPNNKPVTYDCFSLKRRMSLADKQILVNVAFFSAFPRKHEEMRELTKSGIIGFKLYLLNPIGGIEVDNDESILDAFRHAADLKIPVMVHAEDRALVEDRRQQMERDGRTDIEAYLYAHPPEAEIQAIKRIIYLAKRSCVHIHFCHISSAPSLKEIYAAKKAGLSITCEVTPHNLFLSSEQYKCSGFFSLTDPPLRTRNDVFAMWKALKTGIIDTIGSDHAPHSIKEKDVDSVWEAKSGVPGLETTLPLLLDQVNKGTLSLAELVRITAELPAKIFCLSMRGFIDVGNWADFVVVDIKREFTIDSSLFYSKAKYSPFDGIRIEGKPVKTFLLGNLVMDEGEIVAEGGMGNVLRKSCAFK